MKPRRGIFTGPPDGTDHIKVTVPESAYHPKSSANSPNAELIRLNSIKEKKFMYSVHELNIIHHSVGLQKNV